jgi:hypothetical protein
MGAKPSVLPYKYRFRDAERSLGPDPFKGNAPPSQAVAGRVVTETIRNMRGEAPELIAWAVFHLHPSELTPQLAREMNAALERAGATHTQMFWATALHSGLE